MLHLNEVAHSVIHITLDIGTHGVAIIWVRQAYAVDIIMRMWDWYAALPQMLAPSGLDQSVESIVGIIIVRLDAPISEEDGLLRIVADVGDVACRIICVAQVLQTTSLALERPVRRRDG